MHTCYSLCTNKILNLGLANFNQPISLLLSLALQSVSSAEQMGKRASMHEMEGYKYLQTKELAVTLQLSKVGVIGQQSGTLPPPIRCHPTASFELVVTGLAPPPPGR